jgi:nucleoside-diphosphate-sugar epimerase
MQRTLVTGASGFVGANLARRLLSDGHRVHLFLRHIQQNWRLEEISAHCEVTQGDIADRDAVRRSIAAAKPEWVFHLSAYGAYPTQLGLQQMLATNVMGGANLLDACIEAGVEAFVQTGSSSEYGYQARASREDDRVEPNSHYAITKAAATHYCQFIARKQNVHAVTARLYSIYGPFEEPTRLMPTLLVYGLRGKLPPLASPDTARDFVYVDDAVEALIRLVSEKHLPSGAIYNVSSGAQNTLADVVATARELLRVDEEPMWCVMPPRPWDTGVWVGDATAIRRDTRWSAKTTIADGLSRTVRWLKDNPHWLKFYQHALSASGSIK